MISSSCLHRDRRTVKRYLDEFVSAGPKVLRPVARSKYSAEEVRLLRELRGMCSIRHVIHTCGAGSRKQASSPHSNGSDRVILLALRQLPLSSRCAMERPSRADRKAKLRAWRDEEQAKARLAFPMPDDQLAAFFTAVQSLYEQHGCFHDTRHSESVLTSFGCAPNVIEQVFAWCEDNGGFCDCEIAGNAQQHWRECRTQS